MHRLYAQFISVETLLTLLLTTLQTYPRSLIANAKENSLNMISGQGLKWGNLIIVRLLQAEKGLCVQARLNDFMNLNIIMTRKHSYEGKVACIFQQFE